MDLYHSTDADGVSILNPDTLQMRSLLESLDEPGAAEQEHPDVSLVHDASGWSVSVFPGGTLTLENLDAPDKPPAYRRGVSASEALRIWQQLARGNIDWLQKLDWVRD